MGTPTPVRRATLAALAVAAAFLSLSVRQLWVRARAGATYSGMKAMSAAWSEPPDDDSEEWTPSAGHVDPPPADATRADLVRWLRAHYPVLALDLPRNVLEGGDRELDLGGGPPRRLYVVPGRGLVGREPR